MSESSYVIPDAPEIETAFRAAHRALESIVSDRFRYVPEAQLDAAGVFSQFSDMVDEAENARAARLGPEIHWQAGRQEEFGLTIAGIDLDNVMGVQHFGVSLSESAHVGVNGDWSGSSLGQASRIYKRECGWDFAPGRAGVWLLMLAPASASGGEQGEWSFHGHLVGFVILHDRDQDGIYESAAHMWTAGAWRRRGIARTLLQEAKDRFNFCVVEEPLTNDSEALLRAYPQFSK